MDEIVLDKKTFEALAMDTRVRILKALSQRRKTQTELSKELALAPSTISEHLEKMLDAGLISRKKDHHKWIYYELTEKGQHILSPQKASVFVFALSICLLVFVGFLFILSSTGSMSAGARAPTDKVMAGAQPLEAAQAEVPAPLETWYLALLAALVVAVALLFFYVRKRSGKQRAV